MAGDCCHVVHAQAEQTSPPSARTPQKVDVDERQTKGSRKNSRQCDAVRMFSLELSPSTHTGSNPGKPRLFASSLQSYCRLLQGDQQGAGSCWVQIRKLNTQQLAVVRFAYHHSGQAFLKQVVNCVTAYWSIGQTQRGVHSRFQHGYHASVLPCWWETVIAERLVKRFLSASNT